MKYFIIFIMFNKTDKIIIKAKYFKIKTQIIFYSCIFLALSLNAASADKAKPSFDCAKLRVKLKR